jgi:hypothetical protein
MLNVNNVKIPKQCPWRFQERPEEQMSDDSVLLQCARIESGEVEYI